LYRRDYLSKLQSFHLDDPKEQNTPQQTKPDQNFFVSAKLRFVGRGLSGGNNEISTLGAFPELSVAVSDRKLAKSSLKTRWIEG